MFVTNCNSTTKIQKISEITNFFRHYFLSRTEVSFTSSEVYIKGVNRTPLSVIIFCFTCLPFPCGGKAQMTAGYEVDATVASNTTVVVK